MRILFAASEVAPFAKTGGLADVLGSLPRAVARRGHECAVVLPFHRCCRSAGLPIEATGITLDVPIAAKRVAGRVWRSRLPRSEVTVYLIEQPDYFGRDDPAHGRGIYQYELANGEMRDYPDNCQRFVFFSRAILEMLPLVGFWPDVLHCNDWQTGLVPVYLGVARTGVSEPRDKRYSRLRTLFTIHNLAYQGVFWHWDMALTGLDWDLYNWRQLEAYGHLNLVKAGIVFADRLSTVSPRYAEEIQTPEYGCFLEGVLKHHRDKLVGILNGADYEEWDPATDPHLPARYNVDTVSAGKATCKSALQRRIELPERRQTPLLGMVSRLVDQKGLGLIRDAADQLLKEDVQLVVLGQGDAEHQKFLETLQSRYPQQVSARIEFNEPLAHQIEAGADLYLMPSRYEPCGLNQIYSLKYGTPPIAHDTGGLHDTITDCTPATLAAGTATGFLFKEYTTVAFMVAVRRSLDLYRNHTKEWLQLTQTGMRQDWSWDKSAKEYEKLYDWLKNEDRG